MNENIDIRMSNYLAIVSNQELRKQFDMQTIMAMEKALVIYTSTTAAKYVEDYKKSQMNINDIVEEASKSKGILE